MECHRPACGNTFEPTRRGQLYCSDYCRYKHKTRARGRIRVPDALRWSVLRRDGFRCRYCGAAAGEAYKDDEGGEKAVELVLDHAVSMEDGGRRLDAANLVTSCHRCNRAKGEDSLDPSEIPPPTTAQHPNPPRKTGRPTRRQRRPRG